MILNEKIYIMQKVIEIIFGQLIGALDPETVKDVIDGVLDKIENKVADSSNKIDDATVLPLIKLLRSIANIDDLKYGSDKQE